MNISFLLSLSKWACFAVVAVALTAAPSHADSPVASNPVEKSVEAPHGLRVSVKMIGPVTQAADLQIICLLRHDPSPNGDKYLEAAKSFDDQLGGLVSALRKRGEFIGEPGETLLFTPPPNSIAPRQVLLIGVGEEPALSLDMLKLAGRIAARESVRFGAGHVSFAPALRDQGSTRIDVAEGDGEFVEQFVLAYDTEMRLQDQGLAKPSKIAELTIEAGAKYFDSAADHVQAGVAAATAALASRSSDPYVNAVAR